MLTIAETLKINDGAPNAFTHSATMTLTAAGAPNSTGTISPEQFALGLMSFTNGNFVIIARKAAGGVGFGYGMYYGLSATAFDRASHDNGGFVTVTLETPENVLGEDPIIIAPGLYDSLYNAANPT